MKQNCANRGSVVILVLWVISILSVIAVFLIYRSEVEWASTVSLERRLAAKRLAAEVLGEQLQLLIADDNEFDSQEEPWFDGDGVFEWERDGYQISLMIEDEGSKLNLNLLSSEELSFLATANEYEILLDWIDPDSELRTEGAERDYYQAQNPSYLPRDGFMASLSELLIMKNGAQLHEKLAPHGTVFGKFNPNVLSRAQFENLLLSSGFDARTAERITDDFAGFRLENRFEKIDDFLQLVSVTIPTRDQLKPLFDFKGWCNLNFVDEVGLKVMLKKAGYNPELSVPLLQRRKEMPFSTEDELATYLKSHKSEVKATDYFTVVSTTFRFRIWLSKGEQRYYLETVQQRQPSEQLGNKWQMVTLSWNFLSNPEVPEPPVVESIEEGEVDE